MEIIFATNNKHKLEEVQQILGGGFILVTPVQCGITEEIPEEEDTLEGNALQKARYLHEKTGMDCFADDTGLEVLALDGAPGVRSARYAGEQHDFEANTDLLLHNLQDVNDRRARFRTAIVLIYKGREFLFEGKVEGTITKQRYGEGGFGYDPVFIPEGFEQTFAEMPSELKNLISHRGEAVAKLAAFLLGRELS